MMVYVGDEEKIRILQIENTILRNKLADMNKQRLFDLERSGELEEQLAEAQLTMTEQENIDAYAAITEKTAEKLHNKKAELKKAHERIKELEKVLDEIEWVKAAYWEDVTIQHECPWCGGTENTGHLGFCRKQKALQRKG